MATQDGRLGQLAGTLEVDIDPDGCERTTAGSRDLCAENCSTMSTSEGHRSSDGQRSSGSEQLSGGGIAKSATKDKGRRERQKRLVQENQTLRGELANVQQKLHALEINFKRKQRLATITSGEQAPADMEEVTVPPTDPVVALGTGVCEVGPGSDTMLAAT